MISRPEAVLFLFK